LRLTLVLFIKMYSVSVKSLIFTFIINFCLFFGQNTDGKELTIDFKKSIIFYKVSVKIRYACVTLLSHTTVLTVR
jgi:hypothetical protein